MRFNGSDYLHARDAGRLAKQHDRVREAMADGQWRTLSEIGALTGDPVASISAQLRHLRKERFGAHQVDKRCRGSSRSGLFEYRLRLNRREDEARAC